MNTAIKTLFAIAALTAIALFAFIGSPMPALHIGMLNSPGALDAMPHLLIAGLIINQATLSAIFTGIQAAFNLGFNTVKPVWNQLATEMPSTTKQEKYAWLGQFPKLREWIGDRQLKNLAAHDYSIKNKKFESTVPIPRDDIDDDTYGVFMPLFKAMGYAAAVHPDELLFAALLAGDSTLCYDGQFFFDTDHPVGDGEAAAASISNHGGGGSNAWYLLDTTRPLKPFIFQKRRDYAIKAMTSADDANVFMRDEYLYGVDARCNVGYGFWQMAYLSKQTLDAANFNSAFQAMQQFKSDEGRPLGITPTLLVCGPTNRAAALTVVKAQKIASGADNVNYNAVDVLVTPYLT